MKTFFKHFSPLFHAATAIVGINTTSLAAITGDEIEVGGNPKGIATFESVGLYLKYSGDLNSNAKCDVEYRPSGLTGSEWKQGFTLWNDRKNKEFRGSLVQLKPGTEYDIRLKCVDPDGGNSTRDLKVQTWSEELKVARTVRLESNLDRTFTITQGGSKESGYVLYEAASGGTVIDVANQHKFCVVVTAPFVIVRGLTLKNGQQGGVDIKAPDVVVERCDISGWGRVNEGKWGIKDGAIQAKGDSVKRIVLQRNAIHHPRADTNTWEEPRKKGNKREPKHPLGPQGVDFINTGGNHVIRYNHIYSDAEHYYNDGIGGATNNSYDGFPHRDSDIHGNIVENCWDDGIEAEGGNINVRIWGNYVNQTYQAIATRGNSMGPIYIWRNVYGKSERAPGKSGGYFLKAGYNKAEFGDSGNFVFHNTVLQPGGSSALVKGPIVNMTTRNNIFDGKTSYSVVPRKKDSLTTANSFDFDLISGEVVIRGEDVEKHLKNALRGKPVYATGSGYDPRRQLGIFHLAPGTRGHDSAIRIPNFNDEYAGTAPDMGAHEYGFTPMEFGPNAQQSFSRPAMGLNASAY
jgi:hypothetical protein